MGLSPQAMSLHSRSRRRDTSEELWLLVFVVVLFPHGISTRNFSMDSMALGTRPVCPPGPLPCRVLSTLPGVPCASFVPADEFIHPTPSHLLWTLSRSRAAPVSFYSQVPE